MTILQVRDRYRSNTPTTLGQVRTNVNEEVVLISGYKDKLYYTYLKSTDNQDFKTFPATDLDIEENFPTVIQSEIILG